MPATISDLSGLNLDDVENRVNLKYKVTHSDAHLAVQYLRCFFDAKRNRPNELIILPQIADWAWHELILDTVRYRNVCEQVFGAFLHHIKETFYPHEPPHMQDFYKADPNRLNFVRDLSRADTRSKFLRERFHKSMELMRDSYGLGLGDRPDEWLEAGWNNPLYRLRRPILASNGDFEETSGDEIETISLLSWLPDRVANRFGIPVSAAWHGVREYAMCFLGLGSAQNRSLSIDRSILCQIAWEEHILWTRRYEEDCSRMFGYFLEHSPRAEHLCPA
jgi:hypothetical protein